jgi:hypothetical protein
MFKKLKAKLIARLTSGQDLIYTSVGNVPVKNLVFHHEWLFNSDEVCFHEWYTLNGKMVKEGAHIYKIPLQTTLKAKQGDLG